MKLSILAAALLISFCACKSAPEPEEIAKVVASASSTTATPTTHVLSERDHLHLVTLNVGDTVEGPADSAFDWSVRADGEPVLTPVPSEGGRARYTVTAKGGTHVIVTGDPKCLAMDGGCGTSKREWTIFMNAQ